MIRSHVDFRKHQLIKPSQKRTLLLRSKKNAATGFNQLEALWVVSLRGWSGEFLLTVQLAPEVANKALGLQASNADATLF